MEKSLFEQFGGTYERQGDYLLPRLTLPAEKEKTISIYGERHLRYLKEYRRVAYINLLTNGKLNSYLADINEQVRKCLETLIQQMKQAQEMTEQLNAENALEWAGRINNIRACAMEIVNIEIIYR
ncbi:MAG: TnpV protein [Lachnospiraceae bacterium]|nr:TnpV protein [Lachnospiraceae bacterium]